MKRILSSLALAAVLGLAAGVPTASAAPWTPPKPKKGHTGYKWLSYGCRINAQGQMRSYATIETWVYKLKSKYGMYRQKVKVQIDRVAGYDDSDPTWREVDSSTGVKPGDVWFQKQGVPGTSSALSDEMRMSHETAMQPNGGQLSAKATIWLKQYGWPKSVWRYKVRSPTFTCPDPSGQLPAAVALPIPNSGG